MDAACQCGAVTFKTPVEKPLALYICHCADCRRQTSSAFGTSAIFPRFKLPSAELLSVYTRPTVSGQNMYCYFCKQCGTRLIHTTPNKNVVSVKGGCLEGLDWSRAVHIWTKSAMIPIPEDAESYSEESTATSYSDVQEALDQPGPLMGNGGIPNGAKVDPRDVKITGLCELGGSADYHLEENLHDTL
ncbi:glutathione-dependent formaldehyde-activating enzyme [Coniella lustricola]|uniref:Glutathione-dependent formaldehyde-activating enzyme n=1 Tax=Coniella lustricola TaxID=2025994 RepID=A0A2T3A9B1_9PEZI|nr:glutathione-dependent formaldehyde-activating enzyme [Coniella lustricola]